MRQIHPAPRRAQREVAQNPTFREFQTVTRCQCVQDSRLAESQDGEHRRRVAKSSRTGRLHHVTRDAQLVSFVRVVRGEYDRRLGNPVLVQDEGEQIVSLLLVLERESSFLLLESDRCPVLLGALFLTNLEYHFLSVEDGTALGSKLRRNVVIQFVNRWATANISRTYRDGSGQR